MTCCQQWDARQGLATYGPALFPYLSHCSPDRVGNKSGCNLSHQCAPRTPHGHVAVLALALAFSRGIVPQNMWGTAARFHPQHQRALHSCPWPSLPMCFPQRRFPVFPGGRGAKVGRNTQHHHALHPYRCPVSALAPVRCACPCPCPWRCYPRRAGDKSGG